MEIGDCAAVGNKVTFKLPVASENVLNQPPVSAGRLAVDTVVCAHDRLDLCVLNKTLKGGQICFIQVLIIHLCIEAVTTLLRSAVYGVMLGAGGGFHKLAVTLKPLNKCRTHFGGQVRVLAVGLLSSSPAGVTENIDVGRPEGKTLIDAVVTLFFSCVVFCTGFVGNGCCHFL